jgi:hypothetical protein
MTADPLELYAYLPVLLFEGNSLKVTFEGKTVVPNLREFDSETSVDFSPREAEAPGPGHTPPQW